MNPTRFDRTLLDEAKRRVTISATARALGLGELKPNGVQRSPFREDRHESFSVTDDRLWHDFANARGGDVVTFIAEGLGCATGDAIKRLLALADLDDGSPLPPLALVPRPPAKPAPPKRDALRGLSLREPTIDELAAIVRSRDWFSFQGPELALRRGMLHVATVPHRGETYEAWIFTDADRKTAQARRLDGEQWPGPDGRTFKSLSLRSDDDHPPGLADIISADRRAVLLCEGEVDALAAMFIVWLAGGEETVGVLCLTGVARGLRPSVLAALQGRRVRIIRQTDEAGHRAALAWLESLNAAGIAADVLPLDGLNDAQGRPAKDLADLCRSPATHETLRPLAAHICGFAQ